MTRRWLTPYAWVEDDSLHVDARLACQAMGVPPTVENQKIVEEEFFRLAKEQWPEVPQATVIRGGNN